MYPKVEDTAVDFTFSIGKETTGEAGHRGDDPSNGKKVVSLKVRYDVAEHIPDSGAE